MGKSKQKRKLTRDYQLSAKSRADRKRAKQDVVHSVVLTSLESKTRGNVYGNVKEIIDDSIAVSPWVIEDSLKCASRIHKQKICNNQLLYKEEAETYQRKHQTSVLGLISTTNANGIRPKGSTLKNKKTSKKEWMKQSSILLVRSTAFPTWNIGQRTEL